MTMADALVTARAAMVARLLEQTLVVRDIDETRSYLSRDFVLHIPLFPVLPKGPWAWTTAMKFFLGGLSGVRVELGDSFGDGELLALHFVVEGTHTGPFGTIAPTGKTMLVSALSLWRFHGTCIGEAAIALGLWDALVRLDAVRLQDSVPMFVLRSAIEDESGDAVTEPRQQ